MKRYLIVACVLVVAVAGVTLLLEQLRARTPLPTQAQLYRMATESPHGRFTKVPRQHKVVVAPEDANALQLALRYYQRSQGGRIAERAGDFDEGRGVITILSEEARYEANLPPWLRPNFDHTVRHEYGHAFLDDLLKGMPSTPPPSEAPKTTPVTRLAFLPYGADSDSKPDPTLPAILQPVVHEFHHAPRDIYGSPYYTSTFGEFIAESYARFCEGRYVPRVTAAFLSREARTR